MFQNLFIVTNEWQPGVSELSLEVKRQNMVMLGELFLRRKFTLPSRVLGGKKALGFMDSQIFCEFSLEFVEAEVM